MTTKRWLKKNFTYGDLWTYHKQHRRPGAHGRRMVSPGTLTDSPTLMNAVRELGFSVILDYDYDGIGVTRIPQREIVINANYSQDMQEAIFQHEMGHLTLFDDAHFTSVREHTLRSIVDKIIYSEDNVRKYDLRLLAWVENVVQDIIIETFSSKCMCSMSLVETHHNIGVKHLETLEDVRKITSEACGLYLTDENASNPVDLSELQESLLKQILDAAGWNQDDLDDSIEENMNDSEDDASAQTVLGSGSEDDPLRVPAPWMIDHDDNDSEHGEHKEQGGSDQDTSNGTVGSDRSDSIDTSDDNDADNTHDNGPDAGKHDKESGVSHDNAGTAAPEPDASTAGEDKKPLDASKLLDELMSAGRDASNDANNDGEDASSDGDNADNEPNDANNGDNNANSDGDTDGNTDADNESGGDSRPSDSGLDGLPSMPGLTAQDGLNEDAGANDGESTPGGSSGNNDGNNSASDDAGNDGGAGGDAPGSPDGTGASDSSDTNGSSSANGSSGSSNGSGSSSAGTGSGTLDGDAGSGNTGDNGLNASDGNDHGESNANASGTGDSSDGGLGSDHVSNHSSGGIGNASGPATGSTGGAGNGGMGSGCTEGLSDMMRQIRDSTPAQSMKPLVDSLVRDLSNDLNEIRKDIKTTRKTNKLLENLEWADRKRAVKLSNQLDGIEQKRERLKNMGKTPGKRLDELEKRVRDELKELNSKEHEERRNTRAEQMRERRLKNLQGKLEQQEKLMDALMRSAMKMGEDIPAPLSASDANSAGTPVDASGSQDTGPATATAPQMKMEPDARKSDAAPTANPGEHDAHGFEGYGGNMRTYDPELPPPVMMKRDELDTRPHGMSRWVKRIGFQTRAKRIIIDVTDRKDMIGHGAKTTEKEYTYFRSSKREYTNADMMKGKRRLRATGLNVMIGLDVSGSMMEEWSLKAQEIGQMVDDLRKTIDIDNVTYFSYNEKLLHWSRDYDDLYPQAGGGNAFGFVYQQVMQTLPVLMRNEIILVTDCGDELGFKLEDVVQASRRGEDVKTHISVVDTMPSGYYDTSKIEASDEWSIFDMGDSRLGSKIETDMLDLVNR